MDLIMILLTTSCLLFSSWLKCPDLFRLFPLFWLFLPRSRYFFSSSRFDLSLIVTSQFFWGEAFFNIREGVCILGYLKYKLIDCSGICPLGEVHDIISLHVPSTSQAKCELNFRISNKPSKFMPVSYLLHRIYLGDLHKLEVFVDLIGMVTI